MGYNVEWGKEDDNRKKQINNSPKISKRRRIEIKGGDRNGKRKEKG